MNYNPLLIQTRLKHFMLKTSMTVEQLAKASYVNYNTIIKLKNGSNHNPTIKTVIGICNALDISIQELLDEGTNI